jgi:ketosteroid isomerase-like protein
MTYLSEDPTYLAGIFLLLAGFFVIALKTTQQGKYLLGAATAVVLALGVVTVEWMWVTDNERIENVVYEVRAAVLKGDADGVLAHLASNVMYQQGDTAITPEVARPMIRAYVSNIHLEFAQISELRTSVGQQTRKGNAEFRVFTKGSLKATSNLSEGMTTMTAWSLGFQETERGVWKISRISPGSIPPGILALPGGFMPSDGSRIGRNDAIAVPRSEARQFPRNRGGRPNRRLPDAHTRTN